MFHSNHHGSKILICTPDYPPRLGGLSTFTLNIENVLNDMNLKYDLLVWEDRKELQSFSTKEGMRYDWIIHIHGLSFQILSRSKNFNYSHTFHLNFFHGSEILFRGRNFFYTLIKRLFRHSALRQFEKASANFSISEFTLKKLEQQGYRVSYDRDFIIHNGIDLNHESKFIPKSIDDNEIYFICMARSVPHKNAEGVKRLVEIYSQTTSKKVKLFSGFDLETSVFFEHESIKGITPVQLQNIYKKCHFNLLLSLDHSARGYYEGFGLTVLEAAQFGTPSIVSSFGGLPEAVHDKHTGWVIGIDDKSMVNFFKELSQVEYSRVSEKAYLHTHKSHGLVLYRKIFSSLFVKGGVDV